MLCLPVRRPKMAERPRLPPLLRRLLKRKPRGVRKPEKALHKLMREDEDLKPLFDEYEIVLAAGDGRLTEEEETKRSYDKV